MRSRTYRFTDKDPVCGEVMLMVEQVGMRGKQYTGRIAILATKSKATIDGILYGDTKRPQNATVMSIATALGFERTWQRTSNKRDLNDELRLAREYIRKERIRMRKEDPRPHKKTARKKRAAGKPKLRLVA